MERRMGGWRMGAGVVPFGGRRLSKFATGWEVMVWCGGWVMTQTCHFGVIGGAVMFHFVFVSAGYLIKC